MADVDHDDETTLGKKGSYRAANSGILGSCILISMEVFATSMTLWNYVPGNWPVILWPTYFVAILFGYQLLRFVEGSCIAAVLFLKNWTDQLNLLGQ